MAGNGQGDATPLSSGGQEMRLVPRSQQRAIGWIVETPQRSRFGKALFIAMTAFELRPGRLRVGSSHSAGKSDVSLGGVVWLDLHSSMW